MTALKPAVTVARRIAEIGRGAWDACAGNPAYAGNPFIRYDFLDALEESNCAVERTGWGPAHLAGEGDGGRLGRRLRAGGWAVLSEALVRGALHASHRRPPAGPAGCRRGRGAGLSAGRGADALRALWDLVPAHQLPDRGRVAVDGRAGPGAA